MKEINKNMFPLSNDNNKIDLYLHSLKRTL